MGQRWCQEGKEVSLGVGVGAGPRGEAGGRLAGSSLWGTIKLKRGGTLGVSICQRLASPSFAFQAVLSAQKPIGARGSVLTARALAWDEDQEEAQLERGGHGLWASRL